MLGVALWISVSSIVVNFTSTGPFIFCCIMFGLIACLIGLPFFTSDGLVLIKNADDTTDRLLAEESEANTTIGIESNLVKSVMTAEFWLLFITFFGIIGTGITVLTNLTELVISRESVHEGEIFPKQADLPHGKYPTTFIIVFSVFNTLGRLIVGMVSDKFLHKFSRPLWLVVVASLMALSQVYYYLSNIPLLFGAVVVHGLAYGGTFALVPTLTCEIFGLKNFGANYGFVGLAPAIGSQLLSTMLAGKLNDHYKETDYITIGKEKHCFGQNCFRYTLLITFAICILSIFTAFLLDWRCKRRTEQNKKSIQG